MTKRVNFLLYGTLLFFFNQVRFLLLYFLHFSFQEFIIWQLLLSAAMGLNFVWCSFFFIFQTFGAKDPRVTHMKLLCSTQLLGWFQNAYYLNKRCASYGVFCLKNYKSQRLHWRIRIFDPKGIIWKEVDVFLFPLKHNFALPKWVKNATFHC